MNDELHDTCVYAWAVIGRYAPYGLPDAEKAELFVDLPTREHGGAAVFAALVHDAAHFLAWTEGVTDTSRGGRYHNNKFASFARQMGFHPLPIDPTFGSARLGWETIPREPTTQAAEQLAKALRAPVSIDPEAWPVPMCHSRRIVRPGNSGKAAMCECGTTIRIALGAFHRAPIRCEACGQRFQLKTTD